MEPSNTEKKARLAKASTIAIDLIRSGLGIEVVALQAVASVYTAEQGYLGPNSEALGGEARSAWKSVREMLRTF